MRYVAVAFLLAAFAVTIASYQPNNIPKPKSVESENWIRGPLASEDPAVRY